MEETTAEQDTRKRKAPDPLPLDALGRTLNVSHGACGKSWHGSLDRTSHCGGCHETLSSLGLFDAHRNIAVDAPAGTKRACRDLTTMLYHGHPLEMDAGGIWYCPHDRAEAAAAYRGTEDTAETT